MTLPLQSSLFSSSAPAVDPAFTGIERVMLDARAWVDLLPGWLRGDEVLFRELAETRGWAQRERWLYDRWMLEPRLTASSSLSAEGVLEPAVPPVVEAMRVALATRYGRTFDSVGFNLYRDGKDGVAWHRDRIHPEVLDPVVALVSLGEPRKLHLRPRGGGPSRAFPLGHGDLLVTGGLAQRTWEHTVHKVASAGPRISLAFRHDLDRAGYERRSR